MEIDVKLSLNEIRALTVLQELPFTIPFEDRVKVRAILKYQFNN